MYYHFDSKRMHGQQTCLNVSMLALGSNTCYSSTVLVFVSVLFYARFCALYDARTSALHYYA